MDGQWIIVTGASGGLGSVLVEALAAGGYAGIAVDLSWAHPAVPALPNWDFLEADVSDEHSVTSLIDGLRARESKPPWGVVNAAGILGVGKRLVDITLAEFNQVFAVNTAGTFMMTREVVRWMLAANAPGRVVNIASQLATVVSDNESHYAASKAAVRHLTRGFAVELAATGICVNSVSPGVMKTPMLGDGPTDPDWLAGINSRIPLGRIAEPFEIVPAVEFCLDRRSTYLTGADLVIDGGWVLR